MDGIYWELCIEVNKDKHNVWIMIKISTKNLLVGLASRASISGGFKCHGKDLVSYSDRHRKPLICYYIGKSECSCLLKIPMLKS